MYDALYYIPMYTDVPRVWLGSLILGFGLQVVAAGAGNNRPGRLEAGCWNLEHGSSSGILVHSMRFFPLHSTEPHS